MSEGSDVSVFVIGYMVWNVVEVVKIVVVEGISVELINIYMIKFLDEEVILEFVLKIKVVVIVEEYQCNGGLGDVVV